MGLPAGAVFPAKGFQLIAYLAANRHKSHSRKFLSSLLWDSASETVALTNLRQLLVRIRRLFNDGELILEDQGSSLAFRPSTVLVDLVEFDRLTASPNLEDRLQGLEIYGGDLLEFSTDATAPFQDWLAIERTALRECFFAGCAAALKDLTQYGKAPARSMKHLEQLLLAIDPEREASYRALIDAYGRLGEIDQAERVFAALKTVVALDEGAGPSPATAALMRRIASARPSGDLQPPKETPQRQPARVGLLMPSLSIAGYTAPLVRALVEDVANELTRYRSFSVLAPHSSLQIAHDSGVPHDNSLLRADYTVSGIFKPSVKGDRLALRLVRIDASEILWVGEFEIDPPQLRETSWRLTKQIASSIGSALERNILEQRRAGSFSDAYFHYLRGRDFQNACDLKNVRRARDEFARAVDEDSGFAQARARIAETLFVEWILRGGTDASLLAEARRQASRSVNDDPGVAIGHWVSGAVSLYQRDFDQVEGHFKDAEVLAPNCADLLLEHGDALSHLGHREASWERFQRALELNPLPPDRYWWFGASIAFARQDFETAIQLCGKLKSDEVAEGLRAASYAMAGHLDEARLWGNRLRETLPGMTLADFEKLSPTRNPEDKKNYLTGLRLAGIK